MCAKVPKTCGTLDVVYANDVVRGMCGMDIHSGCQ